MWLVVVLVVGGIAAGLYYYSPWEYKGAKTVITGTATNAPVEAEPEPKIRYPIPSATPSEKPLPTTPQSTDDVILSALTEFIGSKAVRDFFVPTELVRRIVVTVDNLPRRTVPLRYRLLKPVEGEYRVIEKGDNYLSNPENSRRYRAYVALAEAADTKKLVSVYTFLYPLFQQEYNNLGNPKGYFNDRLIEVLDDLLAAPEISGPIPLVRPKVFYQFADVDLESRSAGQKILIRMGPEQARRIKVRLREIRHELTGQAP